MRHQIADQLLNSSTQQGDPDKLSEVRELIAKASAILKKMGPHYERVGWLVEDSLGFLDEAEFDDAVDYDTDFSIQRAKVLIGLADDVLDDQPKAPKKKRKVSAR